MPNEHIVTLENIANGAAVAKFQQGMEEIVRNALDPNTKATAKRTIILTFTLVPDESRKSMATRVDMSTKLASTSGITTVIYPVIDNDQAIATERNPQQPSLFTEQKPSAVPTLVPKAGG